MRSAGAIVATLVGVACAPGLPDPAPGAMDPAWGWNGETTDVRIRGADFYPRLQAGGSQDLELDRQFRVFLVGEERVELERVDFRSQDELAAEVPPGLEAGRYDLEVEGPAGGVGLLRAAFTVTDTRADHLELAATDLNWPVYSLARLDIELADPTGAGVPDDLEIDVLVRGLDQPGAVRFEETLDGQSLMVDLDDGRVGVRGRLGPDGRGHVTFTSTEPADLWLDVAPADPTSIIASASQFLSFTPADAVAIAVAPVDPGAPLVAGQPFDLRVSLVDEYDNVVGDASAGVTLFESCGSPAGRLTASATVVGSTILEDVVLYGASVAGGGDTCDLNRIDAIGNVFGSTIEGSSGPLAVAPGPADRYAVRAWPPSVEAGVDDLLVEVRAVDAVGNTAPDHAATLSLRDDQGGLSWGSEAWSCGAFEGGSAACAARPVAAAPAVVVSATGDAGVSGAANPVEVAPSTPAALTVVGPTGAQAAGTAFPVQLRALDAWGNGVVLDVLGVDQPAFTDGGGAVACTWLASAPPTGTEQYQCVATRAESDKVLVASVPSRGLVAETLAFEVTNGPLAAAVLTPARSTLTAGDTLTVGVRATDAWGNAYRVQTTTALTLWDRAGDVAGDSLALDSGGLATAHLRLTTAFSANAVLAFAGGTAVGTSAPFDVEADDPVALTVAVDQPWAWVDEERDVTVTAVDDYGNAVPGYAGPITLTSTDAAGDSVTVAGFSGGQATAAFTWDAVALQDALEATDGTLTGTSGAVDAVEACSDGPTASLTVGGADSLVLCRVGGTTASTALSTAGSATGSGALVATHFAPTGEDWARVSGTSTSATWGDTGSWLARALVVDDAACASLDTARVWVADNDGEAAGPVSVTPALAEIVAGSAVQGATAVSLAATDCAGDPAAGATLLARVELGSLASGTSTLTSTGDGLAVVLDGSGEANLSWSVVSSRHAGQPDLLVGRDGGEAFGSTSVTVTGDAALPVVLDVSPVGSTSALFSEVVVDLSEPMLASTIGPSTVALTDPSGTTASATASLSSDLEQLTLSLPSAQDAGAGVWTLALGSNVRDEAGNRLDGTWSGASGAFSIDFGAVTDSAPDVTGCAVSPATFRPDGDPGSGVAAESTAITGSATAQPAWWELEITDEDGDLVYLWRTAAGSAAAALTWDGRDQDGRVVENGSYVVALTALDDHWNAGVVCEGDVSVDNRVHPPE